MIKHHRACAAIVALVALLQLLSTASVPGTDGQDNRFLSAAQDLAVVSQALEREREHAPWAMAVTGVTVPHHILAADLIARGILAAQGVHYDRVLIISPDHFRALNTPFGTTTSDLETVTGRLFADREFGQAVL